MRTLLASYFLALLFSLPTAHAEGKAARKDNTAPEGFVALFNGKDLTGWQGAILVSKRSKLGSEALAVVQRRENDKILPHWKVEDGVLVNDGHGGNLATTKDYRNFELYCDWKIEPKGDSGLYLRGIPQVQIWDSDSLDPKRFAKDLGKGSGSLWNNSKDNVPLRRADKAPGEWNTFHVVMKGDKVTVHLNGEKVVDAISLENIWERNQPLPAKGPIELQQHPKQDGKPGRLWFKNIYLKELQD